MSGDSEKKGAAEYLIAMVDLVGLMRQYLPRFGLVERRVSEFGVVYRFVGPVPSAKLPVQIALYASEETAHTALRRLALLMSIGPTHTDLALGEERFIWKTTSRNAGSVLFRRDNALIYVGSGLPLEERLALASRLDEALKANGREVRRSASVLPPVIVDVRLPSVIRTGQRVTGRIEVAHISPADALLGTRNTNVVLKEGVTPSLTYYAPGKAGRDEIVLYISTPGNLLSERTIRIDVTDLEVA